MRYLLLLLLISCGAPKKNTFHNSFSSGSLDIKDSNSFHFSIEELTKEVVFRRFLASSDKNLLNDPSVKILNIEETEDSLPKENTIALSLNLTDSFNYSLYLWDLGQEHILPSASFTLQRSQLERILKKDSYLFLKFKFPFYQGDIIFDGKQASYTTSYPSIDSLPITIDELFSSEGSDYKQWFHRETPFGELMLVYASKSELKEKLHQFYTTTNHQLSRENGIPSGNFSLKKGITFLKVTSEQLMNHISPHGQISMRCRPSNIITSQSNRFLPSEELRFILGMNDAVTIKENYSRDGTETWLKIESPEGRSVFPLEAKSTFFYETKCDRKVLKNFEAKLSLKIETFVEINPFSI